MTILTLSPLEDDGESLGVDQSEWTVVYEGVPPLFVEGLVRELERAGFDREVSICVEDET